MRNLFILGLIIIPLTASRGELSVSVNGGISGITSNSVIDIDHGEFWSIWLGTGGGASVTYDQGITWTTYGTPSLPSDEVSALAVNLRDVWVGSSHSQSAAGSSYPYGDGISLSRDGGQTWRSFAPEQANYFGKLSYDLAVYDSMAYSACFYGGLIRTTDFGQSWQNLFPSQLDSVNTDSIDYNSHSFQSLGNRFFSVKTDTTDFPNALSVWGGCAGGIYRFFFYADTTTRAFHSYPDSIAHYFFSLADTSLADSLKLPGNHVVALAINQVDSVKTVWAACRPVASGEARRVAFSTDDGLTWRQAAVVDPSGDDNAEGWDFAFARDTVYIATSFGLFWSAGDYGSWNLLSGFIDAPNQSFYQDNSPFYSVDYVPAPIGVEGTVWAGGADGVVKRVQGGWQVFRSQIDPNDHYAYPSPFSPSISVRKGTTIHFKPSADTRASVKIYDFNLELVKTVTTDLPRRGGIESDDIVWDGTNDKGKAVANGVYFYRIELGSGDDLWGKVVVIK